MEERITADEQAAKEAAVTVEGAKEAEKDGAALTEEIDDPVKSDSDMEMEPICEKQRIE